MTQHPLPSIVILGPTADRVRGNTCDLQLVQPMTAGISVHMSISLGRERKWFILSLCCLKSSTVLSGTPISPRSSSDCIQHLALSYWIISVWLARFDPAIPDVSLIVSPDRPAQIGASSPSIRLKILCEQYILVLQLSPAVRDKPHDPYSTQGTYTRSNEEYGLLTLERGSKLCLDDGEYLSSYSCTRLSHGCSETKAVTTGP